MPGVLSASSVASVGATAGMKRAFVPDGAPQSGDRIPHKKRKVLHSLHHTQPTQNIVEHISAELDDTRQYKEFFDQQLKRAIAVECKGVGFDGAKPEALERFRGLADSFMRNFLTQVRKSMTSGRRTTTVPHDWVYALKSTGIEGSSILESQLDTGEVPPELLLPPFGPPEPADPPPPDLEGLLGPELSGRLDKEQRTYIPTHFPPFPPKHTWKATAVVTKRESDPRIIRERATEEGVAAEKSLRRLMEAQKSGLQGKQGRKQRRSKRIKESDTLWLAALVDMYKEEDDRAEEERDKLEAERKQQQLEDERDGIFDKEAHQPLPPVERRTASLQEGVYVNYEQKFLRRSARGS